ncbi:N-acetylglucosamine kinase [Streptomyces hesseae]|uniref:BadF/BadG/BcrA/BcrD ATPase family protein n=1 Tax=Streptomyces hesseae TaxID=3075519 RepID=A0ABU2SQ23_9ACTN|nr:BadF/BadG/BcrA/BcrD ATPase family protein [Streptomyces sp. DSM 40473]MDT0451056.1 BadF/BadG/BcrA/BcrD ATPase family protein [Streptomyces sp. DSM 40473]
MSLRTGTAGRGRAGTVLGVDSGGSGLRVALAPADGDGSALTWSSPVPVGTGERGIDAPDLLDRVLPAARRLLHEAGSPGCDAVCVGAAGMATLGDDLHAVLPGVLRAELGARRLALASDAVTAYAGALGQRPGVVVAAGTGVIALGTSLGPEGRWRRADGWGHLLGDCGGGAWIGRAGMEAAMRAFDGRVGGSPALLARLEAVFGPACGLPGKLYPRPDRPAVLASFAPEVGRCAADDPVAAGILREAARHLAAAAAAACPSAMGPLSTGPGAAPEVALTGGLFRMGEALLSPVQEELQKQLPQARLTTSQGDPLTGALRVATALAEDTLALPVDGALLRVVR